MSRREFGAGVTLVAVAVLTGLLAALISLLGDATRFEPVPRGDQLGQETGESFREYTARADDSVSAAPAAEPVFALVTFADVLAPAEASKVLEPFARVNAVTPAEAAPKPAGEPSQGRDRTENIQLAAGDQVVGAIVRDTGDVLRTAAHNPGIAALEALPPDAVWGAFGVRPVELEARESTYRCTRGSV